MAKKHTHKYYYDEEMLKWCCARQELDCGHFMPIANEPTLKNKMTICWGCELPIPFQGDWLIGPKPGFKPLCGLCQRAVNRAIEAQPNERKPNPDEDGHNRSF